MPTKTGKAPDALAKSVESRLLDITETAAYLHVSTRWVRRSIEERRIPFARVGRLIRFRESDLAAFLDANTIEATS